MSSIRRSMICSALLLAACGGRDAAPDDSASAGDSVHTEVATAVCFRADRSVMGRESPLTGRTSTAPGWIRLDSPRADSGAALLIDADGAAMDASWKRAGGDSLAVLAFDDFLRVTLSIARADTSLAGTGLATSDATLVRDSAGRLRDLRREWAINARAVVCDSLPPRAQS